MHRLSEEEFREVQSQQRRQNTLEEFETSASIATAKIKNSLTSSRINIKLHTNSLFISVSLNTSCLFCNNNKLQGILKGEKL